MSNRFTGAGPRYGLLQLALACTFAALAGTAGAEGIHPYNLAGLPLLGDEWKPGNPYRGNAEIARAGGIAFNQNCARCHGLEAISGGISPDLRKLDGDCTGLADKAKQQACFKEMDDYFVATVRHGRVRDGRVYMPPFEGTLTQEAIWAIRTYIETRREP